METEELKKFIGKKVKVSYLVWGDLCYYEGILEKINKSSIRIDGRTIRAGSFGIEEVKNII